MLVRAAPPELYLLQDFKMLVKGVSLAMKQVRGNVSQMGGGICRSSMDSHSLLQVEVLLAKSNTSNPLTCSQRVKGKPLL